VLLFALLDMSDTRVGHFAKRCQEITLALVIQATVFLVDWLSATQALQNEVGLRLHILPLKASFGLILWHPAHVLQADFSVFFSVPGSTLRVTVGSAAEGSAMTRARALAVAADEDDEDDEEQGAEGKGAEAAAEYKEPTTGSSGRGGTSSSRSNIATVVKATSLASSASSGPA
jgi:hypothetical protein